jgi:hypothetical protein
MRNKKTVVLWQVQVESANHCLTQVAASLNLNRPTLTKKAVLVLQTLRPIIPYCLHPTGDDGKFILLNRDYRPLGNTTDEWVDYTQYKWAHHPQPPAGLLEPHGRLHFFVDGYSAPWNSLAGLDRLVEELKKFLVVYEHEEA